MQPLGSFTDGGFGENLKVQSLLCQSQKMTERDRVRFFTRGGFQVRQAPEGPPRPDTHQSRAVGLPAPLAPMASALRPREPEPPRSPHCSPRCLPALKRQVRGRLPSSQARSTPPSS